MIVAYLLIAMLGAAVAFFTLQNPEPTAVSFFHWHSVKLPLSLLMLFSALAGVLLTAVSGFAQQLQMYRRIRYLEQRLAEERRLFEFAEERRFAKVSEPPSPSPARVEAAPERMPERMRI
jgi:uncharacterized integral membrane protein